MEFCISEVVVLFGVSDDMVWCWGEVGCFIVWKVVNGC